MRNRLASGFAGNVQLAYERAEGVLLVVRCIQYAGAAFFQVVHELLASVDPAAQGQQVDTVAYELLHVEVVLSRSRKSDHHVLITRYAVEEQFE